MATFDTPEYITEADSLVGAIKRTAYTSPLLGSFNHSAKVQDEESAKEALVLFRDSLKYWADRALTMERERDELLREKAVIQKYFKGE
jgi:hypothetical protein